MVIAPIFKHSRIDAVVRTDVQAAVRANECEVIGKCERAQVEKGVVVRGEAEDAIFGVGAILCWATGSCYVLPNCRNPSHS
jgi:hypothetical protein